MEDQHRYKKFVKTLVISAFEAFGIVFYTVFISNTLDGPLGQPVDTKAEPLPDLQSRIGLILETSVTAIFWSFVSSFARVQIRFGEPTRSLWQNFIQNYGLILRYASGRSILWVVLQLIFLTFWSPEKFLRCRPTLIYLYFFEDFVTIFIPLD